MPRAFSLRARPPRSLLLRPSNFLVPPKTLTREQDAELNRSSLEKIHAHGGFWGSGALEGRAQSTGFDLWFGPSEALDRTERFARQVDGRARRMAMTLDRWFARSTIGSALGFCYTSQRNRPRRDRPWVHRLNSMEGGPQCDLLYIRNYLIWVAEYCDRTFIERNIRALM